MYATLGESVSGCYASAVAAILATVAVPAADVDSTAVAGGAAGVEKVDSGRKNEVIGRDCTAAVEAVVEGAEVLATAFFFPSTFMLLEVSIRGDFPPTEGMCVVYDPQANALSPR